MPAAAWWPPVRLRHKAEHRYDLVTVLKGTLFSGLGVAHTRVADNLDLYETKTGLRFFLGTLNLRLPVPPDLPDVGVRIDADEIRTTGHRTDITLVPARLRGERIFLLRPQVPVHDPEVLEVLAPFSLRERFDLHDGDEIAIEVDPDAERAAGD